MYIPRRIVKRPSVRISLWIIVSMINSLTSAQFERGFKLVGRYYKIEKMNICNSPLPSAQTSRVDPVKRKC